MRVVLLQFRLTVSNSGTLASAGLVELQNQIERRAQHILNTSPEVVEREAQKSGDMEKTVPAVFDRIHEWLLQPGNGERLFSGAETMGAGSLTTRACEAISSSPTCPLEQGCDFSRASLGLISSTPHACSSCILATQCL